VKNQFSSLKKLSAEEIERAVAFGVDRVSEIGFNGWKYGDHHAAVVVAGCIVELLAGRKFHHRELLLARSFSTAAAANPDGVWVVTPVMSAA
jgi:hypothetical protein